jgi:hypothetical protein
VTAKSHTTTAAKPVIVLEHGAWADASSWDAVIARTGNVTGADIRIDGGLVPTW